jgi:hypothetical protein
MILISGFYCSQNFRRRYSRTFSGNSSDNKSSSPADFTIGSWNLNATRLKRDDLLTYMHSTTWSGMLDICPRDPSQKTFRIVLLFTFLHLNILRTDALSTLESTLLISSFESDL